MTDKQAEALNLAKTLYEESQENPDDYRWQAAHELESLHARVVELEEINHQLSEQYDTAANCVAKLQAELVAEAARTAEQKLRADQMSKQHDAQAALNRESRNQLAQLTSQLEAIGAGGVESLRKKGNA